MGLNDLMSKIKQDPAILIGDERDKGPQTGTFLGRR
jgi:hypothetical protein